MKRRLTLLFLFLIILIYPFLIKYTYVSHNQYEQIPLIFRYLNPSYLSNDWSINVNSQFSPRNFYTHYMGFWGQIIGLPLVYYSHYVLTIGMVALATYYLTRRLFKSEITSLFTMICILFGTAFTIGSNDLVGRDLDPPRLAFALVVLGFTLLVERKRVFSAVFFSLASYIHPLIGFEIPVVFYISFAIAQISTRKNVQTTIQSFVFYLILSSYSFYSYLQSIIQQLYKNISPESLFTILSRVRAPAHYLPSSWSIATFIVFFLYLSFAIFFYWNYSQRFSIVIRKTIVYCTGIILMLSIIGYMFAEIIPIYTITTLQLFRLTVLIYWFSSILIFGGIFYSSIHKKTKNIFIFFLPLVAFIIASPNTLISPGYTHFFSLFIALLISLILYITKNTKIQYILVLLLLFNFSLLYRHYSFEFRQTYPFPTEQTSLELWVKSHTDKDSVFLIPPDFYSFRLTAERATIVEWLVMPFEPEAMIEWMNRIKNVSGLINTSDKDITEQKVLAGYYNIDAKRISILKKQYRFSYIIVRNTSSLPYTKVFSNNEYTLYKI